MGGSPTAVNLALGTGGGRAKVGILDADTPRPINSHHAGRRKSASNVAGRYPHGTDYVSWPGNQFNWLSVTDDNAMVWRGPMASKALMQMLQETLPDLDYLVLDMPPGTVTFN
ncbi:P-loop NTPase [Escherichia coli]